MSNVERKSFNCDCKSSKNIRNNHNNLLFFASFDKNDYLCRKILGKSV